MKAWFVAGEPAVWMGSREKNWKLKVAETVDLGMSSTSVFMELDFGVASMLRTGQAFDLDNMVTPVFAAILGARHSPRRRALAGWRAYRAVTPEPGLHLRSLDALAPTFPPGGAVVVLDATLRGRLPTDSRDGGVMFVAAVRDALGAWTPERTHRFALELQFGDDVRDITWVEEAPIKPVVDCLFPVFGGPPGAPDDWKVDAIQVGRGRADLRGACAVRIWVIPGVESGTRPHTVVHKEIVTLAPQKGTSSSRRSGMTNFECLDAAAQALGSPPAGFRINDVLTRAAALFPGMASVSKESASATADFQTINVRGRASRPSDFESRDRWNTSPAFLKVERGVWRRLSEEERAVFVKLWTSGERLLRQGSYDASDWDGLFAKSL